MKKRIIVVVMIVVCSRVFSQDTTTAKIITADSLASGNYKDVLTSFFQLAFENLTGPERELKFSTNPFAVMLRANPKLLVDTSYRKFKALRNLNFAFSIKLDSNFSFNGFSSGVNYAIVNKRDYTIYKSFPELVRKRNKEFEQLHHAVDLFRSTLPASDPVRKKLMGQKDSLLNNVGFKYSDLDPGVKSIIDKVISDSNLVEIQGLINADANVSIAQNIKQNFEDVRNSFKKKLLWTVGVTDTTYSDQLLFSNIVFSTQILKGFGDPKKSHGFEFDVRGMYNIVDDTLTSGRDLKRSLLNFEGGLNYVWRSKRTDLSFFEFKMSAAYSHIFNGIYADEREEIFTLNGTLRVRIFDDIWVPVQFKYDPDTGNVFGFLNVRANFTSLKKILTQQQ